MQFCWSLVVTIFLQVKKMRSFLPRCGALAGRTTPSRLLLQRSWQTGRRCYSIQPGAASTSKPQDIDVSKLVVETTKSPKPLRKNEELIFGQTFTGQRDTRPCSAPMSHTDTPFSPQTT